LREGGTVSEWHKFRFSISLPYDCPFDEEVTRGIIQTAGTMIRDGAKARSFDTPHAGGHVRTSGERAAADGIVGTVFHAHLEIGREEYDIRFLVADVTMEEPPPSSKERFTIWHRPDGMLH
jgi:hypothetical protein